MAIKNTQTKRPAASMEQVSSLTKSGPATKKNKKNRTRLTPKKCHNVIAKLKRVDGIPDSLQAELAKQSCVLLGKRAQKLRVSEDEAATILKEAAGQVGEALQFCLQEAHANIKEADFDKRARESAQVDAESSLERLKQAVVEERKTLSDLTKSIEARRKAIKTAKITKTQAWAALKAVDTKKKRLASVEHEAFGPLKETLAEGHEGQKRLCLLRKIGKEYGFHNEMMSAMPAVLKKDLDKRQTFDGMVVDYLGVEFARHRDALDAIVQERETAVADCSSTVQEAHSDLQVATEEHKKHTKALADAEKAVIDGKAKLLLAKRHVRRFPSDMGKSLRNLSLAKTRVEKFRKGPLADLEQTLPPTAGDAGSELDCNSGTE